MTDCDHDKRRNAGIILIFANEQVCDLDCTFSQCQFTIDYNKYKKFISVFGFSVSYSLLILSNAMDAAGISVLMGLHLLRNRN